MIQWTYHFMRQPNKYEANKLSAVTTKLTGLSKQASQSVISERALLNKIALQITDTFLSAYNIIMYTNNPLTYLPSNEATINTSQPTRQPVSVGSKSRKQYVCNVA